MMLRIQLCTCACLSCNDKKKREKIVEWIDMDWASNLSHFIGRSNILLQGQNISLDA